MNYPGLMNFKILPTTSSTEASFASITNGCWKTQLSITNSTKLLRTVSIKGISQLIISSLRLAAQPCPCNSHAPISSIITIPASRFLFTERVSRPKTMAIANRKTRGVHHSHPENFSKYRRHDREPANIHPTGSDHGHSTTRGDRSRIFRRLIAKFFLDQEALSMFPEEDASGASTEAPQYARIDLR